MSVIPARCFARKKIKEGGGRYIAYTFSGEFYFFRGSYIFLGGRISIMHLQREALCHNQFYSSHLLLISTHSNLLFLYIVIKAVVCFHVFIPSFHAISHFQENTLQKKSTLRVSFLIAYCCAMDDVRRITYYFITILQFSSKVANAPNGKPFLSLHCTGTGLWLIDMLLFHLVIRFIISPPACWWAVVSPFEKKSQSKVKKILFLPCYPVG